MSSIYDSYYSDPETLVLEFSDHHLLQALSSALGLFDLIEKEMHVSLHLKGSFLAIRGGQKETESCQEVFDYILTRYGQEKTILPEGELYAMIQSVRGGKTSQKSTKNNGRKTSKSTQHTGKSKKTSHNVMPMKNTPPKMDNVAGSTGFPSKNLDLEPFAPDMPSHKKATSLDSVRTPRKIVFARTQKQKEYIASILNNDLTMGIGLAGTGKSYLAVACGVHLLATQKIEKIILTRPIVEAGERLGFLPGDLKDKIDPYLRPIYDALGELMHDFEVQKRIENGTIEIAPLAYMRGRTLSNALIILDEAQNTTPVQMKMFLTRLGEHSKMVITGDLSQVDLPKDVPSGLRDAARVAKMVDDIRMIEFETQDIVRHPLVTKIVQAYDKITS